MAETKQFPTLIVASTITGIGLTNMKFSDMHECAEWLCGHPVWTHELVHGPTKDEYITEGYEQFPAMPTPADAEDDYVAAAAKAISAYGETVEVRQGNSKRHEGPMQTLRSMVPDADVIAVTARGAS
jgi:hypothetical protein